MFCDLMTNIGFNNNNTELGDYERVCLITYLLWDLLPFPKNSFSGGDLVKQVLCLIWPFSGDLVTSGPGSTETSLEIVCDLL